GSVVAPAQTNREWPIAANAVAHRQGVILQRREGLRPIFARMNVGAVSEMSAAVELHRFSLTDGELRRLAQEAQRIAINEAVNRLFWMPAPAHFQGRLRHRERVAVAPIAGAIQPESFCA